MTSLLSLVTAGVLATSVTVGPKPKAKPGPTAAKPLPNKRPSVSKPLPTKKVIAKAKAAKCTGAPLLRVSPKAKPSAGMFRTIAGAAAHARSKKLCRLRVQLSPGVHPNASKVTLDRPTTITGPRHGTAKIRSSLVSRVGVAVEVSRVTFDRPKAAALDVRHTRADTKLRQVVVLHAPGSAIVQHGGKLDAKGLVTSHTSTQEGALLSGAAVRLSGGVKAKVAGWMAAHNGAHALVVHDRATRVELRGVRISDTGHHPEAVEALEAERAEGSFGAVVVQDHATLLGDDVRVTRSDLVGVVASGGAEVRFRNFRSHAARSVPGTDGRPLLGDGVTSYSAATVQLEDFRVTNAARVGLNLRQGYVTARDGRVTGCLIGVTVVATGFRSDYDFIRCLEDGVLYTGNTVNLDTESQVVPIPPGEPVPTYVCPEVH